MIDSELKSRYDVVIVGGGLAGLALARHLLLDTDKTILLVERKSELPPKRQKVGESSVQVAGFYYGRVLELEEYLWLHQFMKYNLRFYWKSGGRDNTRFEDYGQSFIRPFSNIPSYQLDRNTFEGELLRRNLEEARFTLRLGIKDLETDLAQTFEAGPHAVRFKSAAGEAAVEADWVVDTSGRGKFLAKTRKLERRNAIRHGAFFWWVEGLVDVDRLTDLPYREIRKKPERRFQGHLPSWLATNHFCAPGLWFWVIPLQGKTSLGLVFDKEVVPFTYEEVGSVAKATKWVLENFPCFARDLPHRKVLDFGGLRDYSHDCAQTINPARWALAGEAGRFTDPLYSPGSDLISIYNTLIVDAIKTGDAGELAGKCQVHEQLMRAVYQAYVPTYATSYDALGDQEVFSLKYTWELTIYFGFYVFPFINDLFTDRRFAIAFLRHFSRLGPLNQTMQSFLSAYFRWRQEHRTAPEEPIFYDFMNVGSLRAAEKTFYEVGVSVAEAKKVLAEQLANVEELARFTAAHVASVVVDDERALTSRAFVEGLDVDALRFDPEAFRALHERTAGAEGTYEWSFDPSVLAPFRKAAAMEMA
jgi:flavin-dependent dehydrogenase